MSDPHLIFLQVVRFIPPLTITKEELAEGMEIFSAAVKEVLNEG